MSTLADRRRLVPDPGPLAEGDRRGGRLAYGPTAGLRVPAARQGPGPISAAAVNALDPVINRLVSRSLPGGRLAAGVGPGTELAQLRPYEPGDDVRYLDPAASARTGTMHVRLHVPERAMTSWIVLDLSASMAFGTAGRLKADVAEGVAAVIGRLGVRRAGSVGVVAWGGGRLRTLPPRGAKPALVALGALLAAGVAPDAPEPAPRRSVPPQTHAVGLAEALSRTLTLADRAGLIAVISDFRDEAGWERPLGALRLRHAVIAVEVEDPRERELPNVGRLAVIDPETGELVRANTASERLRRRFAALEAARRERIAGELRRLQVRHVRLSTDADWLAALGGGLR
ncbi:DUF58 domain-containing protein [Conexibacter sp. DBS9H8]|uniref:DUF58 domain-containing protein n=1 Tax=Conexibacter sp. DBS9H8 TaxID=2937801 RepID=UPI00200F77E0|nr:DUF58 domain-containing protein [Conexibacter sp. DBS9H8]